MHIDGPWFKDEHGRTLILRGANLGGSTKVPYRPDGATYIREGFFDHRAVSFVGRPFPLDEADEHFARLRAWGMTFLRFLITWEAIEHAGPGQYDEEYLDYVYRVIKRPASTASTSSSTRIRMCGAASPAATARRAGRSKPSAWTSHGCRRPAQPSSTPSTAIRSRA